MSDRAALLQHDLFRDPEPILLTRWDRDPPTVRVAGRGWSIPDQPIPSACRTSPRALRAWAESQPRLSANDA